MARATIVDVADHAGVSKKTVSRVINSEPNVRDETRDKVLAAIEVLNFRRNPLGHRLAHNRSFLIALVYDNPSPTFLMGLQKGIVNECRSHNMGLFLHECDYKSDKLVQDIENMITTTSVDGVILSSPVCDHLEVREMLDAHNITHVSINTRYKDKGLAVCVDNYPAAIEVTNHLINLGHKDIAYVIGHPDLNSSLEREKGFRAAMQQAGLSINEKLMIQGKNTFDSGRIGAIKLLANEPRPTAIFANNDDMASGIMYELQHQSISVPDDISVVGFDNTSLSRQIWPRLTTTGQPFEETGRTAMELLMNRLNDPKASEKDGLITMPAHIIVRESSKRIA